MPRRKKVEVLAPDKGDEVTMLDWSDNWITVRVTSIGESPTYGTTVEGSLVEDGVAHKHIALPLDRLVQTARVHNVSHGKWDVTLPDGKEVRVGSKKAAQELCVQVGVVFQEV